MAKYIYNTDNKLRCRLKRTGYNNQIELQLQKKSAFFWINCYKWMHIQEGFWGEDMFGRIRPNPMVDHYRYGHISEAWATGTLNIKNRVFELFKEYYLSLLTERNRQQQFESI